MIKIGSWEKIVDGSDAIIISYGYLLNKAMLVKELLKDKIDIAIVNARFQKPIDEEMFKELLNNYKNIYIYEEQMLINSLGSYLVNYANLNNYKGNINVFAIEDKFVLQGSKEEILKEIGLDEKSISNKILKNYKNK